MAIHLRLKPLRSGGLSLWQLDHQESNIQPWRLRGHPGAVSESRSLLLGPIRDSPGQRAILGRSLYVPTVQTSTPALQDGRGRELSPVRRRPPGFSDLGEQLHCRWSLMGLGPHEPGPTPDTSGPHRIRLRCPSGGGCEVCLTPQAHHRHPPLGITDNEEQPPDRSRWLDSPAGDRG